MTPRPASPALTTGAAGSLVDASRLILTARESYTAAVSRIVELLYVRHERLAELTTDDLLWVVEAADHEDDAALAELDRRGVTPTSDERCEVCGRSDRVAYRGWTDEGSPIATCPAHGDPDTAGDELDATVEP